MKRKIVTLLLTVAATTCLSLGLAACGGGDENDVTEHTHTYAEKWTFDEDCHWHAATCEHTDKVSGKMQHNIESGICTVCGYEQPHVHTFSDSWTSDETYHWRAATCGHTDIVSEKEQHNFQNGVCAVCGKQEPVEYVPGTENLQYVVYDSYACLTGLGDAESDEIIIASMVDGKPVTTIASGAFTGSDISKIVIPATVTKIESNAFGGCRSLVEIWYSGNSLQIESWYEFADCPMPVLYFKGELPPNNFNFTPYFLVVLNSATNDVTTSGYAIVNIGGLRYAIEQDTAEVYNQPASISGDVIIPSYINYKDTDIPVVSIASEAFNRCLSLTGLIVPDSVISIGEDAINDCYRLRSLTIPLIGKLNYPRSLRSLTFTFLDSVSDSVMINMRDMYNLEEINLPYGITQIKVNTFYGCSNLKSITIPDSVTSIGDSVFYGCNSLESITLPFLGMNKDSNENNHLGYLFGAETAGGSHGNIEYVPKSLKSVTISGGTKISDSAFYECYYIENLRLPDGLKTIGDHAFYNCTNLKELMLPDGLETIGDYAFYNCTSLTAMNIPMSVKSVGDRAFCNCLNLRDITLENVETIGEDVFEDCPLLEKTDNGWGAISFIDGIRYALYRTDVYRNTVEVKAVSKDIGVHVKIPDSVRINDVLYYVVSINENAFLSCPDITSIQLPESVNNLNQRVFAPCRSLESIEVYPANKTYTSVDGILYNLEKTQLICAPQAMTQIEIENTVTSIDDYAFQFYVSLEKVTLPDGLKSIGNSAFEGCYSLKDITFPDGLESIGNYAFHNCAMLTDIVLPDGLESIGNYVFQGCASLERVVLPDGLKSIGKFTFNDCDSLKGITLPNSLESIEDYAFAGCDALQTISIPKSVTRISDNAFFCESLESIFVDEENAVYASRDGVLYDKALTQMLKLPARIKGNVIVPDTVEFNLDSWRYCRSDLLTGITIGDNDTKYTSADGLIYNKDKTELLYVPHGIENVVIADSVISITEYAFSNCNVVKSITLPYIGVYGDTNRTHFAYLFGNYVNPWKRVPASLKTVILTGGTEITASAFSLCTNIETIILPNGIMTIGANAFSGCISLKSVNIPLSVVNIEHSAFYNCKSLVTVELPKGLTTIGDHTFFSCDSLEHIILPDSLTSIGSCAFYGCTSLEEIVLQSNISTIGQNAFEGCDVITIKCEVSEKPDGWNDNWCNTDRVIWSGEDIYIDASGYRYANIDGLLFALKDGKAKVVGAKALIGSVIVPAKVTYDSVEYAVVEIAQNAFNGHLWITDITIEEGIETIGYGAFASCMLLTRVNIPMSVTVINANAFYSDQAVTIYCAVSQPAVGWSTHWREQAGQHIPVVWNCGTNEIADDGYIYNLTDGYRYRIKDGEAEFAVQAYGLSGLINIPEKIEYNGVEYKVVGIVDEALRGVQNIIGIVIPASVNYIGSTIIDSFLDRDFPIYFNGTFVQFCNVDIGVVRGRIYCYSYEYEREQSVCGYWYFDANGNPIIW